MPANLEQKYLKYTLGMNSGTVGRIVAVVIFKSHSVYCSCTPGGEKKN